MKLFKEVSCQGYLQKIWDGRFVEAPMHNGEIVGCEYVDTNNPNLEIKCKGCGDRDFLKTYYKYREKDFKGFVVGEKDIVLTGYLVVDMQYTWDDRERYTIKKAPSEIIRCAIVYYGNNKKRFVPLDKILEVEQ